MNKVSVHLVIFLGRQFLRAKYATAAVLRLSDVVVFVTRRLSLLVYLNNSQPTSKNLQLSGSKPVIPRL